MLNFIIAILAGLVCGVLSGFGIGGGSLLMVWMTAVLSMEQKAAQGINLLYFLPTAVCALIFHAKHRQICWKAVLPAAIAGCAAAVPGALLAASLDMELLRKLFGGFLIAVGLVEIFCKGLKKKSTWKARNRRRRGRCPHRPVSARSGSLPLGEALPAGNTRPDDLYRHPDPKRRGATIGRPSLRFCTAPCRGQCPHRPASVGLAEQLRRKAMRRAQSPFGW